MPGSTGARLPLSVSHPELAAQVLPPQDPVLLGTDSRERIWWRGPLGHVWQATVGERLRGEGCPVCSRLRPPEPGDSLADTHPDIAEQADGWDPGQVSAGSRVTMPWSCSCCGTTWTAEVRARARGYRPCPACALDDHPPLTVTHPALAEQMVAPFNPEHYTRGSKRKVRWRGPLGHEWEATVANRVKGSGCPVCAIEAGAQARRQPPVGASLADIDPAAAADAEGWDPTEYRARSSARLPWRCAACGHRWTTTVYHRTQGPGCPACSSGR